MKLTPHNRPPLSPRFTLGGGGDGQTFVIFNDTWEARYRTDPNWSDNEELLAQGRYPENARQRTAFNSVPYYESRAAARLAFQEAVARV